MKTEAYIISKIYASWINECAPTHSAHTISSYEASMSSFLVFLEDKKQITSGGFFSAEVFSRSTVMAWLNWMKDDKNLSPQTCNVRLANLRSFAKYMGITDAKYRNLYLDLSTIKPLKIIKKKVTGMSQSAIKAILHEPDTKSLIGIRDAVMLSLLYMAALRIEELISLKIKDLNLQVEYPYIIVLGKGKKIRSISIPKKLASMISKYISIFFSANYNKDEYLFFSRIKGHSNPISRMGVAKRIKIYGEAAKKKNDEVPQDLHAHQFRHARATHWLDEGLNIAQVSKLLGHADISTTMVYLDINEEMISCAVKDRMDDNIKNVKPIWNKTNSKSLRSVFGIKRAVD